MCSVLSRLAILIAAAAYLALAPGAHAEQGAVATKDPREALADAGYQFSMTYIGEGLANVSGGVRTGAIDTGRLDLGTTIDLEKGAGWTAATLPAKRLQM